eukprot:620039-Hanusia_phi.AAC.1
MHHLSSYAWRLQRPRLSSLGYSTHFSRCPRPRPCLSLPLPSSLACPLQSSSASLSPDCPAGGPAMDQILSGGEANYGRDEGGGRLEMGEA